MNQGNLARIRAVGFDFDGVFTTNFVWINQDGVESVACSRSDGIGLNLLPQLGIKVAIFSTEANPVVSMRAKKLKVECFQNCTNKTERMAEWLKANSINPAEAAFVGNDVNDIACMKSVGLAVAVADAYPQAKAAASLVLIRSGGMGAVREFCEILFQSRQRGVDPYAKYQ